MRKTRRAARLSFRTLSITHSSAGRFLVLRSPTHICLHVTMDHEFLIQVPSIHLHYICIAFCVIVLCCVRTHSDRHCLSPLPPHRQLLVPHCCSSLVILIQFPDAQHYPPSLGMTLFSYATHEGRAQQVNAWQIPMCVRIFEKKRRGSEYN